MGDITKAYIIKAAPTKDLMCRRNPTESFWLFWATQWIKAYYTGHYSNKFRIEFDDNKFAEQRMVASKIEGLLSYGLISFDKREPEKEPELRIMFSVLIIMMMI